MVLVTASGSNALRMDLMNFDRLTDFDSVIVTKKSTSLVIAVDGYRYAFSGVNVKYNNLDEPVSGTITGFTFSQGGNVLFQVGGVSAGAAPFYQATYYPGDPLALLLSGDDEYRGSALNDYIYDKAGHNVLIGREGSDVLIGGDGNDHIWGQSASGGTDGADSIAGGGGNDYLQGNAGADNVDGGPGADRIQGGADGDVLWGGPGNDTINGNRGNDDIIGWEDNDLLRGGQGTDQLNGFTGNDTLMGDLGSDTLIGGPDDDLFVFGPGTSAILTDNQPVDHIMDFGGGDRISVGFTPAAVLIDNQTLHDSLEAGRIAAQAMIDQHAGDHEVVVVRWSGGGLLYWSGNDDGVIDSVVWTGGYPSDFIDAFV